MATSPKAFLIELYEEYLEEASFLYEQRRTLFQNPQIAWKKIGDFEERLEAHIDGLVVGGKLALEVSREHAGGTDCGELYAATCLFCRQDRSDLVLSLLEQLDPADAERADALTDALKHEVPKTWIPDLLLLLENGEVKCAPILAQTFGYSRLPCGPQLIRASRRCTSRALPHLAWALGRMKYEPAAGVLFEYLRSEDDPVRSAAALALARLGDARVVEYCLDNIRSKAWPASCLGLAGGRWAAQILGELAATTRDRPEYLVALGLHGDPVNLPLLVSRLGDSSVAPAAAVAAAVALQAVTGAGLSETVFVADVMDDDELFESERSAQQSDAPLLRGDGKPFGSDVTRLSQNPEQWDRWLRENGGDLVPGIRYRHGRPTSPHAVVSALADETSPYLLRRDSLEEFAIRYGYDCGFEADSPVRRQITNLASASAWSDSKGQTFPDGSWCFAGKMQSELQ